MISNWVAVSVTLVLSGVVNMVHVLCPNPLMCDNWMDGSGPERALAGSPDQGLEV
jgi:hypothetical protein